MRQITFLDRLLLLATGVLAAYQVAAGMDDLSSFAVTAYTVAFGVLLVAGLLLMLLGFEILEAPAVAIVATIVPLSLSAGLVAQHLPRMRDAYLALACAGFLAVALARIFRPGRAAALTLAAAHGFSGLLIFGLPLAFSLSGRTPPGFALVGIGGGLIGVGGLLLAFLKAGRPILSRSLILAVFPGLLFLTTAAFVGGFWLA